MGSGGEAVKPIALVMTCESVQRFAQNSVVLLTAKELVAAAVLQLVLPVDAALPTVGNAYTVTVAD